MVLRTFNTASDVPDPWEMYGQRDFKSFPAIRQELRRSVYEAMGKKLPAESAPTVAGPAVLKFSGRVPASTATVSVLVQVDGKPAEDLTAADFALTDNGVVAIDHVSGSRRDGARRDSGDAGVHQKQVRQIRDHGCRNLVGRRRAHTRGSVDR
jgi:hypothetical protein